MVLALVYPTLPSTHTHVEKDDNNSEANATHRHNDRCFAEMTSIVRTSARLALRHHYRHARTHTHTHTQLTQSNYSQRSRFHLQSRNRHQFSKELHCLSIYFAENTQKEMLLKQRQLQLRAFKRCNVMKLR